MPAQIIVPEWVARNERRRQVAEDHHSGYAQTRYWNPLLREIDPRLSLIFVGRVTGEEAGVVPYRWHIVRTAEGAPDTYWAITTDGIGEHGGFREMGSDVLETLRAGDLWNESVIYDRQTAARRVALSKERAKETRKEARVDDLAINIRALRSPGVTMSDTGWTWRKSGRRGRSAR
jgi:hypothetical protein